MCTNILQITSVFLPRILLLASFSDSSLADQSDFSGLSGTRHGAHQHSSGQSALPELFRVDEKVRSERSPFLNTCARHCHAAASIADVRAVISAASEAVDRVQARGETSDLHLDQVGGARVFGCSCYLKLT